MKHWHKVIILVLCVLALFYFDSREKAHARNSLVVHASDTIRLRIGSVGLRSHCYVSIKKRRKPVKCPVCNAWVRTLETRPRANASTYRRYECANEHRFVTKEIIERVLIVSNNKRKRA